MMEVLISDNAKFAIGDIYNYSIKISPKYASKVLNGIIKQFSIYNKYHIWEDMFLNCKTSVFENCF